MKFAMVDLQSTLRAKRSATMVVLVTLVMACGSGTPASSGSGTPPGGGPPVAAGATTFHMVLSDGPKAGTYDLSTTDPGACSVADVGYFGASYLTTSTPGLDYISATLHPGNLTGLSYAFDADTDAKVLFTGTGTVTVNVDDRGATATMTVVSEKNFASADNPPTSTETGRAELTVQCGSVLRAN
jgi:hypothetical protein